MKIIKDIKTLAALLIAGVAFTACSTSSDDIIEQPVKPTEPQVYTMVIKASKATSATTRALSEEGNEIKAYWTGKETIDVYKESEYGDIVKIGTATAAASETGSTTITATLTDIPSGSIRFFLHGATFDYTGQVGLLTGDNSISNKYDYANGCFADDEYEVNGNNVIPKNGKSLDFYACQAIVKFTLVDKSTDAAINVKNLTIHEENNYLVQSYDWNTNHFVRDDITINSSGTTNVIYAALYNFEYNHLNLTLTATTDEGDTYTYTRTDVEFNKDQYYAITVKMEKQRKDLSMADCAGKLRSTMSTANCYMVHKAGQYKLPLVYGNAIKNGADNEVAYHPGVPNTDQYCANFINHKNRNITAPWITKSTSGEGVDKGMGFEVTSAELLWQDAQGLITAVGIDGDYLTLTVGKDAATQEGNAIVAAKLADGTIVWSWHIWVTKQTFSDLTEINAVVDETSHTYTVTPVNLGWVGEATSTTGYCTYYQWGRKDPFIPSTGTGDTNHTVYNIGNEESTGLTYSTSNPTIADNIKNPTKHYYYSRTQGPCSTKYNNMWDAQGTTYLATTIKTVYDPCPPGFCVPDIGLYDYIISQTKSEWNTGYTYNGVFFPASGCRGMWEGALFQVGSYGYYWSVSPSGDYSAGTLFFTSESWDDDTIPRAFGCPVRAVAED